MKLEPIVFSKPYYKWFCYGYFFFGGLILAILNYLLSVGLVSPKLEFLCFSIVILVTFTIDLIFALYTGESITPGGVIKRTEHPFFFLVRLLMPIIGILFGLTMILEQIVS